MPLRAAVGEGGARRLRVVSRGRLYAAPIASPRLLLGGFLSHSEPSRAAVGRAGDTQALVGQVSSLWWKSRSESG